MAKEKIIQAVLVFFLTFTLISTIAVSTFDGILNDFSFYEKEFRQNGVYDKLPKKVADAETGNILEYLHDDAEIVDTYTFNMKEVLHLRDVKSLIRKAYDFYLVSFVLFMILLISLYFFDEDNKRRFVKAVSQTLIFSGSVMAVSLLFLFFASSNFSQLFLRFHESAFSNDLWQLNPQTDVLVLMFPEPFFLHFLQKFLVYVFLKGVLLLLAGLFIKRHMDAFLRRHHRRKRLKRRS